MGRSARVLSSHGAQIEKHGRVCMHVWDAGGGGGGGGSTRRPKLERPGLPRQGPFLSPQPLGGVGRSYAA